MKSAANKRRAPFLPIPGLIFYLLSNPWQIADIALKRVSTGAGEKSLLYSMVRSYNSLLSEFLNLLIGVFKREVLRFSEALMGSILKCGV